jgi:hypothetical protein
MMPAGAGGGAGGGAGAAEPVPGAFDPAAFQAAILAEFNKGINALDKKINAVAEKLAAPPNPNPPAPGADPNDPPADPPKAKTVAEVALELQRVNRTLEAEVKKREASEKVAMEKEALVLEANRKAAFMESIQDLPFAVGKDGVSKARAQFIDAYMPKVKRAEDGEFVVDTEAGPVGVKQYMQSEFEASPYLAAPQGHGGSGAAPGARVAGGNKMPDYASMTATQLSAIPVAERDAHLAELVHSLT